MSEPGPIVRFSRDRKGYEHFYLLQPSRRPRGRARLLYWFRTPPGVRVGREAFDAECRRAIEQQNPGVTFDWDALLDLKIPSAEDERWRERRRERQANRAAQAERSSDADADLAGEPLVVAVPTASAEPSSQGTTAVTVAELTTEPGASSTGAAGTAEGESPTPESSGRRRRRRRRRRRDGNRPAGTELPGGPQGITDEGAGAEDGERRARTEDVETRAGSDDGVDGDGDDSEPETGPDQGTE